jgi:hypothetical protein
VWGERNLWGFVWVEMLDTGEKRQTTWGVICGSSTVLLGHGSDGVKARRQGAFGVWIGLSIMAHFSAQDHRSVCHALVNLVHLKSNRRITKEPRAPVQQ